MPIEAVNQVAVDGRIRLPPALQDKYEDDYLAIYEDGDGRIILERVDVSDDGDSRASVVEQ